MLRSDGSGSEDGFTLIELLVSLTIMGVILVLLGGALRVLSHNWDANAAQIGRLDMISRAADILRRDASALTRVVAADDEKNPRFVFKGDPGRLSFVAVEPPYPTEAGPYFIDYSIAAGGGGAELVRARAPYRQDMRAFPGATPANRVSLLEGPFQYQFTYAAKEKGGLKWYGVWPFQKRLPDVIRLDIADGGSGGAVSPPIVVAVDADAELGCLSEEPAPCSADGNGELRPGSARPRKDKTQAQNKTAADKSAVPPPGGASDAPHL